VHESEVVSCKEERYKNEVDNLCIITGPPTHSVGGQTSNGR